MYDICKQLFVNRHNGWVECVTTKCGKVQMRNTRFNYHFKHTTHFADVWKKKLFVMGHLQCTAHHNLFMLNRVKNSKLFIGISIRISPNRKKPSKYRIQFYLESSCIFSYIFSVLFVYDLFIRYKLFTPFFSAPFPSN